MKKYIKWQFLPQFTIHFCPSSDITKLCNVDDNDDDDGNSRKAKSVKSLDANYLPTIGEKFFCGNAENPATN